MAKLTPEEYLKQKTEVVSDKKISPEEYLAQKNTTKDTRVATDKVQTPEEYLANKQKTTTAPKSTLQKVGEFLVPTITKTIDKAKKGEDITKRDVIGSGLEAASYLIPGTAIAKGVGLGIKAGTLASKIAVPAAIGGVSGASFGAGQAVAEGEDLGGVAKRALKDTAIGAVAGGAIGAGLSKLAQRKAAQEAAKIIPEQTPAEVIPEVIPQPITKVATEQVHVPKVVPETQNYYHGGDKINTIDLNKSNYAKTFFVTDSKDYAKQYAGKTGVINDIQVNPNAKLIDIKNEPKDVIDKIRELGNGKLTGKTISITKPDGSIIKVPEKTSVSGGYGNLSFDETLDGAIRGKSHFAEDPNLVKIYKELGYDGMVSYEDTGMRGKNIGIWNKNMISIPTSKVAKVEPKDYARYENALEKDPIFVKGAVSNPDIINNYAKISKEVPTDELIDMVYGVNGKRLPNELPPSAVYNMLRSDVSKLTPKQAERLLNKQPLSKAGFDLQAAKIKSGEVITNPLEYADMIETQLKEKVASVGSVTKKSIKKFLDDNQCTLS